MSLLLVTVTEFSRAWLVFVITVCISSSESRRVPPSFVIQGFPSAYDVHMWSSGLHMLNFYNGQTSIIPDQNLPYSQVNL